MRARRAVVLGRLGRGAVVVGQGDEAEDLSGGRREEGGGRAAQTLKPRLGAGGERLARREERPSYLVLGGHLLVAEVADGHLAAGQLADLVLGPLAGLARVEEVAQRLVVDLHEARREGELRRHESLSPARLTRSLLRLHPKGCCEQLIDCQ